MVPHLLIGAYSDGGIWLTKRQPKREFWKPSRGVIDICHMRCDDEVRR
jgi:hypothetical protein